MRKDWTIIVTILLATLPWGCNDASDQAQDTTATELTTPDTTGDSTQEDTTAPYTGPWLADPEGVLVLDGLVFVTNINATWDAENSRMDFQEGFLTVFDAQTLAPIKVLFMPFKNPQEVVSCDSRIAVVCSGTAAMDENWVFAPEEDGGVVWIDAESLEIVGTTLISHKEMGAMAGYPGPAAWDRESGRLFVGSGTGPYVFATSPDQESPVWTAQLFPEGDGKNDLVTPAVLSGELFATSFQQGLLVRIDPNSGTVGLEAVDVTPTDDVEGAVDLVALEDKLLVLFTLSSRVVSVDPADDTVTELFTTGATPNRMVETDGFVYVVNSGENNLTRYDEGSRKVQQGFAPMEIGMNPWDIATGGEFGFVTGYMDQSLVRLNLDSGAMTARYEEKVP